LIYVLISRDVPERDVIPVGTTSHKYHSKMKSFQSLILFLFIALTLQAQEQSDLSIFQSFMNYSKTENLQALKNGERVAAIAKFFINSPYVGGTLEAEGPERLQVNLRGFDCTTFVEIVLALNLTIDAANQDFDNFRSKLKYIRYRDGVLNGYPSRLHYTTDWIFNNQKKGLVKIVSTGGKSISFPLKVGYMSTHPESYLALKDNPEFVREIADQEKRINQISFKYLPKNKVEQAIGYIKTGDIIAITTNIAGLDFSHLGFAVIDEKGQVHLLHASSSGKKVMVSEEAISDYLADVKKHTGIIVARPR